MTGDAMTMISTASATNGYPRSGAASGTRGFDPEDARGQKVSSPARISSSLPSNSSTIRGHGSALTYGSRTVPRACSPPTSPDTRSSQRRGLSNSSGALDNA